MEGTRIRKMPPAGPMKISSGGGTLHKSVPITVGTLMAGAALTMRKSTLAVGVKLP